MVVSEVWLNALDASRPLSAQCRTILVVLLGSCLDLLPRVLSEGLPIDHDHVLNCVPAVYRRV